MATLDGTSFHGRCPKSSNSSYSFRFISFKGAFLSSSPHLLIILFLQTQKIRAFSNLKIFSFHLESGTSSSTEKSAGQEFKDGITL